jgi:hypothetical protein
LHFSFAYFSPSGVTSAASLLGSTKIVLLFIYLQIPAIQRPLCLKPVSGDSIADIHVHIDLPVVNTLDNPVAPLILLKNTAPNSL